MSLSRPLIAFVGVGVLGIAGVSLGAGATFTDATQSRQTITAGSLDVTLSSDGAEGNDSKVIVLPNKGPTGSTFQTLPVPVTMTNHGTAVATEATMNVDITLPVGYKPADAQLRNQMSVCIYSPPNGASAGRVIYAGPVNVVPKTLALTRTIAAGESDSYTTEFYAGSVTTACRDSVSLSATGLNNAAQGGTFTPSVNVNFTE